MRLAYPPTTLRSRVHGCVAWLAVLLLLPVVTAQGQTTPGVVLPASIEPLSQRFFPPIDTSGSPRGTLTPFLSLGERYDDNIFLTSSGKASDFITLPAGGIRLRYAPSRVTALDFDYRLDGDIFAKHTDQNTVSNQGEFRYASQLNPSLSFNVHDTFLSTTEPLQRFTSIDQATGLRQLSQQSRVRTLRNTAGGTVEVRVAERGIVDLLFEHVMENVSLAQELDETRYSIGAEVGYLTDVARRSKAYVSYVATFFTFDQNSPTTSNLRSANFQVHTATAGFRHSFTPTLSGNAALGYARTQSDDPAEDNLGAIVANLNVTKLLRDGQVTFGYSRDFTSGGGAGGAVRENALLGTFFWKVTPKVTTIFAGKYALFDFKGAPVVGTGTAHSFLSLRPGLAYQILPLVNVAFYYTYEATNFDRPSPDVVDQRFSLISQLALRERLFLNVTYDYSVRHLHDGTPNTPGPEHFARNQVMLLLTYAPTFRF
jgi:hypothetical protein